MHYESIGTAGAAPLLFVHAFPFDSRLWRPQREGLAARHRVITCDLLGFGQSVVAEPPATLDTHAEALAGVLDKLGVARATLVGLSMGGYVALAFARLFGARLEGLVLCDTRAAADTLEGKATRAKNIAIVQAQGVAAFADPLIDKLVSAQAPDALRAHLRDLARAQPAASVMAALAAMRDRRDETETFVGLQVPVTLIAGREDQTTPAGEMRALATKNPRARFVEIAGAGHLSNIEQPEAFNRAVVGDGLR